MPHKVFPQQELNSCGLQLTMCFIPQGQRESKVRRLKPSSTGQAANENDEYHSDDDIVGSSSAVSPKGQPKGANHERCLPSNAPGLPLSDSLGPIALHQYPEHSTPSAYQSCDSTTDDGASECDSPTPFAMNLISIAPLIAPLEH